jgi:hypothetical protein
MDLAFNFIDCLSIIFLLNNKKNSSTLSNTELILAVGNKCIYLLPPRLYVEDNI